MQRSRQRVLVMAGLSLSLSALVACGKKKEEKPAGETPVAETKPAPAPTAAAPAPVAKEPAVAPTAAVAASQDAAPAAPSQDIAGLTLESGKLSGKVKSALDKDKLMAHGKEYPVEKYCNDNIGMGGELEVFSVSNNPKQIVYLCPSSMDGVPNVVSVFEEGKEPLASTVNPEKSTYRIDDDVLLATVKKLLTGQ